MEEIKVYNTLTKEKEVFKPITPGEAKIYVCGVTPYNHPHIGNARPAVTWDVIRRYLEYVGYKVEFVQNFTDVDDKIINKANAEGTDWKTISDRYIDAYFQVMDALHVRRADVYPRVSEHMDDIIHMVETLIKKGHAYVLGGDVYYDISTFKDYGRLSGRKIEDMLAGARIEVNDEKRNPGDFALWKAAKPGEPFWESPWGKGRPGWHIECSTMSMKYLGKTFDFHGGGSDLIFPHHENEIAQSEGATGCHPFVRYWLHNGFITVHEEKMSKSLGNFFTVKDILAHFEAETLRFFILSTHYRSPLDFSDQRLKEADASLQRLRTARENLDALGRLIACGPSEYSLSLRPKVVALREAFLDAMRDDFNTALAISHWFALAKEINIYKGKVDSGEEKPDGKLLDEMEKAFDKFAFILGVLEQHGAGQSRSAGLEDKLLAILMNLRQEARKAKNYAQADAIRNQLADAGVIIEDTPQGPKWKIQ